jgi:hypothetical protein
MHGGRVFVKRPNLRKGARNWVTRHFKKQWGTGAIRTERIEDLKALLDAVWNDGRMSALRDVRDVLHKLPRN